MIAADSQYEVSFRPNWGDDGPIGHVVVRRLDDRAVVAEAPVLDRALSGLEAGFWALQTT